MERQTAGFGLDTKSTSNFLTRSELDYLAFLYQAGFWKKMKKRISASLKSLSNNPWDYEVLKFKIADSFPIASKWNKQLTHFNSLQSQTIITLNQGSLQQSYKTLKFLDYIFPARFDLNALLCLLDSGVCQNAVKLYGLSSGVSELPGLSFTKQLKGSWQNKASNLNLLEFHLFLYALGQTYKINNRDLAILAGLSPLSTK